MTVAGTIRRTDAEVAAYNDAVAKGILPGRKAQWVEELRKRGITRFAELGYPTLKHEGWRYTNVADIAKGAFVPTSEAESAGLTLRDLSAYLFAPLETHLVVLVNGRFDAGLSSLDGLPERVRVESLAAALERDPTALERHLAKHADHENEAFVALNTALFTDGVFIEVPAGVVLERPVHILHVQTPPSRAGAPVAAHPRHLVVIEDNAQAKVVESYVGFDGSTYFTNAVTEVVLGKNAHLHHVLVQRESEAAYHMHALQVHQDRDSNYDSFAFTFGALLSRLDVNTVLDGEGSHATLDGIFALRGSQHADTHTKIDHAKPHCTSWEVYKGIVDGESRGIFHGKIHVHPDAQKTDAKQSNNNLILSNSALVDSTPQLEIYADDVKCTHGSTIGQLDPDAVFYLRSRGYDQATARTLLTYAFARDVTDNVKIEEVRHGVNAVLLSRLPGGAALKEIV